MREGSCADQVARPTELEQPGRDAERWLRSYKLRFSRCVTCFSVLAALLSATALGAVTKEQVLTIVKRTPLQRLEAISGGDEVAAHIGRLLELYQTFLVHTDRPKKELVAAFHAEEFKAARSAEGQAFGDEMFELLQVLGRQGRAKELFRHMVV